MTRGRSRIRKQVYRPITKSLKATEVPTHVISSNIIPTKTLVTNSIEVPIKNSFSFLVNILGINNEVELEKEKKKIQSIDDVSETNRLSQNRQVVVDPIGSIHSPDSLGNFLALRL
ncbi:hypothetical protein PanWU01x14_025850 [Parasponia andersonii]|uniref:Uncharacterized protein n=1 Tax=Parasponia andersonii TaxID=3476 RepID=A0A2P5DVW4_PARAD|nr:hypothetical protein PanWU01x14_025850 [Parasponia andersonii]